VNAFLPESPYELYQKGDFAKIPLLLTVNAEEGLSFKSAQLIKRPDMAKKFNEQWHEMAPEMYHYEHLSPELKDNVSEAMRSFYFGNKTPIISEENFENFTNSFSDILFIFGSRVVGLQHAKHAPTYAGVIDIKGTWSGILGQLYKEPLGMAHADDLQYVFNFERYPKIPLGSDLFVASHRLIRMYVNFAKFGNPNYDQSDLQWKPISESEITSRDLNWMYIRNKDCEAMKSPLDERMKFCDEFYRVVGAAFLERVRQNKPK